MSTSSDSSENHLYVDDSSLEDDRNASRKRRQEIDKHILELGFAKRKADENESEVKPKRQRKTIKKDGTLKVAVNAHLADGAIGKEMIEREEDVEAIDDMEKANSGEIEAEMAKEKTNTERKVSDEEINKHIIN